MKKVLSFCVAILLSIAILFYVHADINEGHGPQAEHTTEQETEEVLDS